MPNTVYCRGCGKQLHPEAQACPHCGAPQAVMSSAMHQQSGSRGLGITSCVLGIFTLSTVLFDDSAWSRDDFIGGMMFAVAGMACGAFSIYHQRPGYAVAVVGLVTAGISLLFCLTNL
jgi:hypothetical protein